MTRYDKPVTIQRQDPGTEAWADHLHMHARVNRTGGGQGFGAGADQFRSHLTFELRYCTALEELRLTPQLFRVVYRGGTYKLTDYDDYQERHQTVRLDDALYA